MDLRLNGVPFKTVHFSMLVFGDLQLGWRAVNEMSFTQNFFLKRFMDSGGFAFNPTVFGPPFYEKGGLAPPAS